MLSRSALHTLLNDEKLYSLFFNSLRTYAIVIVDTDGLIIKWNEGAENLFGYTEIEVYGVPVNILYQDQGADFDKDPPAEKLLTLNRLFKTKHHKQFYGEVIRAPMFDAGKLVGYSQLVRTVAEPVLADERNTILESIGDAFFATDKNWVVTYWNSSAERVLHRSKSEMLNHNLWEIFSESIGSRSWEKYHEALETQQAVHFEDYYPPLEKWYEISAYPSANGLSVYFKDITERIKHTKAIEDQNKQLQEISWIQSHIVRAPLTRIMGLVSLIIDLKKPDGEDENMDEFLKYLQQSANELDEVIKNITLKSKVSDFKL